MGTRNHIRLCILAILIGWPLMSWGGTDYKKQAEKNASKRLFEIARISDLVTADSPNVNPNSVSKTDGNSYEAATAYHAAMWSRCLRWFGNRCGNWLAPLMTAHRGKDSSPVEQVMDQQYEAAGGQISNNQYHNWEITMKDGGQPLDNQGRLNMKELVNFRLNEQTQNALREVGTKAGNAVVNRINRTRETTAEGKRLGYDVGLRYSAYQLHRAYRNNLLARLGEYRLAKAEGPEVDLDLERFNGDEYTRGVQRGRDPRAVAERRLEEQGKLSAQNRGLRLEDRVALGGQMKQVDAYEINPITAGGRGITTGGVNTEPYVETAYRLSLAAVDYTGIDLNQLPRQEGSQIDPNRLVNQLKKYDESGNEIGVNNFTNAQQLQAYNNGLAEVDQSMKRMEVLTGGRVRAVKATQYAIQPGTRSAAEISGPTFTMKGTAPEFFQKAMSVRPIERLPAQVSDGLTVTRQ